MKLDGARVLLTGATGGIGRSLAVRLADRGAALLLAGRDEEALESLRAELLAGGCDVSLVAADISSTAGRLRIVEAARRFEIDVLINNAGINDFGLLREQADDVIEQIMATNATAPMLLTRALLPQLLAAHSAAIVNVGSVLGSLATPGQAAYAASKAALRLFGEGLRRELAGSRVAVSYVGPRATDTGMNAPAVRAINERLGVRMDSPERVARRILRVLEAGTRERILGWPERLFVRLNALVPSLVDRGLVKQLALLENRSTTERTTPAAPAVLETGVKR